ncbi:alpha-1,4-glucan--maltose-1-phosphate maltosyltransferase [Cupriavidus basilensis]|uniref:Alpha-1,4-glucan:maltose-1-phosphate maltosyltransferase n=1 Tax=Cupriavidus basilensis TaxID=68895 RepID=A0A643G261_9BURK|nr:alpha-1,4-glucan--maltose-1-phosphate maltosyltransferase [Cupriavidus basilensis]QOT81905.1 alpha-1,4-glucan--maltose-1-phosphate maltosyltransferase [Cupriavidus basilensis]
MRICQIDLTLTQPDGAPSNDALARAAALGFDHVLLAGWPVLHPQAEALAQAVAACSAHGLSCLLELALDRYPDGSANLEPCWREPAGLGADPRDTDNHLPGVRLRWHDSHCAAALVPWWSERLRTPVAAGIAGFVCRAPARVPGRHWAVLIASARRAAPGRSLAFLAWAPGLAPAQLEDLTPCGFDGAFCSLPWWDYRSAWLTDEIARLRPFGAVLAAPALNAAGTDALVARRALWAAAAIGDGLMVPAGFETGGDGEAAPPYDLSHELIHANAWLAARGCAPVRSLRRVSGGSTPLTVLARTGGTVGEDPTALAIVINPDTQEAATLGADRILAALPQGAGALLPAEGGPGGADPADAILDAMATIALAPAGIQLYHPVPNAAQTTPARRNGKRIAAAVRATLEKSVAAALNAPRIAIENVTPACEGGRFAVRRVLGERVEVEADIWMDGHDKLAAVLLWRGPGEQDWQQSALEPGVNDRWSGSFPLRGLGRHEFTLEAWRDTFASWCDEVGKKKQAGVDVTLEIEEGARLVAVAADTASSDNAEMHAIATDLEALRDNPGGDARRLELLLSPRTRAAMQAADPRAFATRHPVVLPVEADRLTARFASWYELFPRSQSGDPGRHGTFDDVIARLPAIRAMGFDVLYFPPIHPIGRTHRKGRNNSLRAQAGDPGSPYAIGAAEGGHDAIHAELGTFDDFRRLREAAAAEGLELALDFAIQCSPDHPWLREHPEWFAYRPDGSLRYAENPPKKYEDIVNVDFYCKPPAAAALWLALRDVVVFWAEQGVRIFRVDNPHTKPLPFWEWMIEDVRSRFPDALFLAEAFTRPKMMGRLAKLGFNQSYTYFTWRNHKRELTEYMTELTQGPLREFFRPHFFVNTPDINPYFLHDSGRPGFLIRAALATLLSGLWGMYSGFELCEGTPMLKDGVPKEEYLDSEKYQLRVRDWQQPGNIVAEISRLNAIRASHPALQNHLGLRFYHASDDAVLYFARFVPRITGPAGSAERATSFGDDVLLAAISLDPRAARESAIELPLWEWGLPDHGALDVEDLMHGRCFTWQGKNQHIRLDPYSLPFALWHVRPLRERRA